MFREEFSFDNLHGSVNSKIEAEREAEKLRVKYNGEIEFVDGNVSYRRDGTPYYACPEAWPKYIVTWEDK